jgi:hypothetical protein
VGAGRPDDGSRVDQGAGLSEQLKLNVDPPLTFIACRADGTPIAAVPVEGDNWNEAALWCYLAIVDDRARSSS